MAWNTFFGEKKVIIPSCPVRTQDVIKPQKCARFNQGKIAQNEHRVLGEK